MKIALVSAQVIDKDITFNLQSMIAAIRDCSGQADLILFGESVLQGFNSLCWDYEKDKFMAASLTDTPIRQMQEAAKEYGIAVSFGYIERVGELLYSSQIVIDSSGAVIHNFHRISVRLRLWMVENVSFSLEASVLSYRINLTLQSTRITNS